MYHRLNVVLVEPLIPQNTGSTARLCAATYTLLHLIEPLGFELSDKYLKRAGLDYWPEVKLRTYPNWNSFILENSIPRERLWFLTKHAERSYTEAVFNEGDYLVFGNETRGLPPALHEDYNDRRYKIPMDNPNVRSINLSNAVSVVLYEARRQIN
jgi:tRNA (cytidine/uridine-2'-O-)-methyltransferase